MNVKLKEAFVRIRKTNVEVIGVTPSGRPLLLRVKAGKYKGRTGKPAEKNGKGGTRNFYYVSLTGFSTRIRVENVAFFPRICDPFRLGVGRRSFPRLDCVCAQPTTRMVSGSSGHTD
jgi:hypothetical protein